MPVEASCPACGAPISFKSGSSIVVVCEFCNSVVARGDQKLENLGKVAAIVETGSPLDIGLRGVYHGVAFELTGRAQLGHEAGGIWDEWYAWFADGRWGWLAEAQGRFYLTFQQTMPQQTLVPPFEMLQLGQPVAAIPSSVPLMVAEKGEAEAMGARGEIPYKLTPGQTYYYADLAGPHGEFATLDYSAEPADLYIGREVTLRELGISETAPTPEREARKISAIQLGCPQCGGPLALRAPDQTQRVTCPNCGSLLDVSGGKLEFLNALKPGKVVPVIPIGSVGEFDDVKFIVIGFMQRSVKFDKLYFWEEYLLYNAQAGFRWLVRSDDHWNFVQSLSPGEVVDQGKVARYGGRRFRIFQEAVARVEYVIGEFYWRVSVGEIVRAVDLISPPLMLSKEVTVSGAQAPAGEVTGKKKRKTQAPKPVETGEVNWSLGTYLPRHDVERIFGVTSLPRPSTVAPNQVFPHKKIYKYWGLLLAATFLLGLIIVATGSHRKVFEASYQLQPVANPDGTQVIFSDPFELKAHQNIRVTAMSPVSNSWLYVEGDLIDESSGLVQTFSMPVEYYFGVDGGESWKEGSQSPSVHLSSLPPGNYTLRLEAQWEHWQQPAQLSVRIEQGVPRILHLFLAMLFVSLIPVLVVLGHFRFERRRWQDSDYSPFGN